MKGSVESVLSRCRDAGTAGAEPGLLDQAGVQREVEEMAADGLRVLAFARKRVTDSSQAVTHADVADGLTFLGLQAMMDPPRQEAIAAVSACQKAGIQVKMIPGDHLATATAIAHQIGLKGAGASDPDSFAVNGRMLAQLADHELVDVARRAAVFARVSPEQKLRLVEALQARGHVVALTGDGVNDAPALKQADIGVAMGVGGTEVAKEAADMVLTVNGVPPTTVEVAVGRPPVPPSTVEMVVSAARTPSAPAATAAPATTVALDPDVVVEQVTSLVVDAALRAALAVRR